MVVDLENLERMDVSEIHSKRLNSKEVTMPQIGENACYLSLMEQ